MNRRAFLLGSVAAVAARSLPSTIIGDGVALTSAAHPVLRVIASDAYYGRLLPLAYAFARTRERFAEKRSCLMRKLSAREETQDDFG